MGTSVKIQELVRQYKGSRAHHWHQSENEAESGKSRRNATSGLIKGTQLQLGALYIVVVKSRNGAPLGILPLNKLD